jgi:hypothetical protein
VAGFIFTILTFSLISLVFFLLFPWNFGVISIIDIYEMGALLGLALTISLIYLTLKKYIKNQTIFPKIAMGLMIGIACLSLCLVGLVCFFIVYAKTNQYNLSISYQYFQMFSLIAVAMFYFLGSYFAKKRNHFNWALSSVLLALIIGALFGISESSLAFFVVESWFFGYAWEILSFLWAILSIFALITTALSKKEFNTKEKLTSQVGEATVKKDN